MFNDPLSVEECVDLVRRLTGTAFPFQCAHGRPSMVPLVSLGSRGTGIGGQSFMEHGEEKDGNLLGDLKRWSKARKSQK
jgi:DNA mismatch repair protein MLH3